MLRSVLKYGFLLILGILVYNRFFGNDVEKEQSKKIFGETRVVLGSVRDLVRNEREKYRDGKYDNAIGHVREAFHSLRGNTKDKNTIAELDKLEQERQDIERRMSDLKNMPESVPSASSKTKGKEKTAPLVPNVAKKELEDQLHKKLNSLIDRSQELIDKEERSTGAQ
jgi:chaperonin cofactor prefoldin